MDPEKTKELTTIILTILILSISYSFFSELNFEKILFFFSIVLTTKIIIKKSFANYLNIKLKIKVWSIYQIGFKEKSHLKKELPMLWLPFVLIYITKGVILWYPILTTKEEKKIQRHTKKRGLYRFSEVTEWEKAQIVFISIISLLFLGLISHLFNLVPLSKISINLALWTLLPLSNLDGSKLLFGSKKLWIFSLIITIISFLIIA